MKKFFSVIAMGCLLTLSLVGSVQAQLPGAEIRAQIPFDFTVRGKTLPAGEYAISRIGDEPSGLLIRKIGDKHENIVFETQPESARRIPRRNVLVFNKYGASYFLEEVVTAGDSVGRELAPSRAERTLRREMAKNQIEPETVMVALN